MEIKEFISESIKQICLGIGEARDWGIKELDGNCLIAPLLMMGKPVENMEQKIHFDIAVVTSTDKKINIEGGTKLKLVSAVRVGGDLKKQNSTKTDNTHRISFTVPFYPQGLGNKQPKK
ncbi:hypothetical protein ACFL0U_03585 [Pseudomonadota bacterium]